MEQNSPNITEVNKVYGFLRTLFKKIKIVKYRKKNA